MNQTNLFERFKSHLTTNKFVDVGDKILLAVSGGLDSVTLLHLFNELKDVFSLQLNVVHVHHGIRGADADRDLKFVQSLSRQLKIPFYFEKVNTKKFAADEKLCLEESARILRYQVFDKILKKTGCAKLVTGHTANDQAETIIDHLFRGSGILGMRGMANSREAFIRPLLIFERRELESYAKVHNLQYCVDTSNNNLQFKRNRIRAELIPYIIKYFNPNIVNTLCRFGEVYNENEKFLYDFAKKAYKSLVSLHKKNEIILDIVGFLNYFEIIKKYIIFHACDALNIHRYYLTFEKLERILSIIKQGKIGKKVKINENVEIFIDHDGIVLTRGSDRNFKLQVDLVKEKSTRYLDFIFRWSIFNDQEGLKLTKNKHIEFVDFNKTGNQVTFRTVNPGDKFIPLNFIGHKKVSDYFSDKKVPHHLRNSTPILEAADGVVWICGYCIDDRFKVTNQTTSLLKIEMTEI